MWYVKYVVSVGHKPLVRRPHERRVGDCEAGSGTLASKLAHISRTVIVHRKFEIVFKRRNIHRIHQENPCSTVRHVENREKRIDAHIPVQNCLAHW